VWHREHKPVYAMSEAPNDGDQIALKKELPTEETVPKQDPFSGLADILKALLPHQPFPSPSPAHLRLVDEVCNLVPLDFGPSYNDVQLRSFLILELTDLIRKKFPQACLDLFGSSVNGFELRKLHSGNSDLDVCISNLSLDEVVDARNVVIRLAGLFKSKPQFRNVLYVIKTRVPIVKFTWVSMTPPAMVFDVDLSVDNTLALRNSTMLARYAAVDPRVKTLGYVVKLFAKMCGVADASQKGLSSYAYIVLVIYFLQQRTPPVVPVLQEVGSVDADGNQREEMVDEWNTWFFDGDDSTLKLLCPEFGSNRESIGELWLGFLEFYTEKFNYQLNIISIRHLKVLTRVKKKWTRSYFAIEDPFELNHNLGACLNSEKLIYIMKTWIQARHMFGSTLNHIPQPYRFPSQYFFDTNLYLECEKCGEMGHNPRYCSRRRVSKVVP
jgi:terminal uridylyltransferase